MEDRETARMRKYGESKTTRIMMATVPHVTSGLGLGKFQADEFLLTRVYMKLEGMTRMMFVFIRFMMERLQADCVCTQIMALHSVRHHGSH